MKRAWSIRTSLILLAVSIVVPLVGLEIYGIWQEARLSAERAEESAMSVAQAASGNVEQLLVDVDTVLAALARWERRMEPDRETCTRHLRETKQVLPQLYHLTVVDTTGHMLCTSGVVDVDDAPSAGDRAWFREVMETGRFTVSEPVQGRISGLWISVFARPIRNADGEVTGVAVSSVDLSRLQRFLARIPLPEGGILTLAEAEGIVVARSRNAEEMVGRPLPGSQRRDTLERGFAPQELLAEPGVNRAVSAEGEERVWAYVPIRKAGWVLYAGFPVEWVYGPIVEKATRRGLTVLAILVLALLAARFLYGRISGSLRGLIRDSEAAAGGSDERVREQGPDEVRRVARQFNRTLEAREKAEERLRAAEEQMQQRQKMEAVGRLAGGVAHDFNNLLTVIRGEASLLAMDVDGENPELRRSVGEIARASERASELVQKLLAFSRQDEARELRTMNPNRVIRRMAEVARSISGPTVDVEFDLEPDVPAIRADPGQIEQVLMNLVGNARDAMPDGGRLTIRTGRTQVDSAMDEAEAGTLAPGRYAVVQVSDTGVGMEPDVRARIFEPFFTTKSRERGTGLGLSALYGVVSGLGGTVRVESTPGEGSTFTLLLPAAPEASSMGPGDVRA